jgi:hypothetical protein
MMRTHKTSIGLFILLVVTMVSLWLSAWAIASPSQQDAKATRAKITKQATDHIPIVDYENSVSISTDSDPRARALRTAKGKHYATRVKGFIADRDSGERSILAFRYLGPLPALPVGRSAVIALGEIVDAQAYLSDDKTGVYSEFSVRIEEVFKNDNLAPLFPGSLVVTERYGGRVRFRSGHVILYGNREQGFPRQGGRYVFFLERNDQEYLILTAYELLSGRVYPLDGKSAPGGEGSDWAGDAYLEVDPARFLGDLKRALSEYSPTSHDYFFFEERGQREGSDKRTCPCLDR